MKNNIIKDMKLLCYGQMCLALLCIIFGAVYLNDAREFSDSSKDLEPQYRQFSQMIRNGDIQNNNREKIADLYERQYDGILEFEDLLYDLVRIALFFGIFIMLLPVVVLIVLYRMKENWSQSNVSDEIQS